MPNTFAGFEIVSQTKNFMVTCDPDPEAKIRAINVSETCESDLAQLNTLFSTNFEAGRRPARMDGTMAMRPARAAGYFCSGPLRLPHLRHRRLIRGLCLRPITPMPWLNFRVLCSWRSSPKF